MERMELAKWLKIVIAFAALLGMFLCFIIAPLLGREIAFEFPELSYLFWPCLIFIWITACPFYFALYKGWQMCQEIAIDNSFCRENARRLKEISRLALFECVMYLVALIGLLVLNLLHPSILLMILFILFVGISIAVVAAALSHLVEKVCDLKEENDLTI